MSCNAFLALWICSGKSLGMSSLGMYVSVIESKTCTTRRTVMVFSTYMPMSLLLTVCSTHKPFDKFGLARGDFAAKRTLVWHLQQTKTYLAVLAELTWDILLEVRLMWYVCTFTRGVSPLISCRK